MPEGVGGCRQGWLVLSRWAYVFEVSSARDKF